jgi:hypothetical protein
MMNVPFTGGCYCGAVRYECTAEPIMMFKCHCRDCQKLSGGGFSAAVYVPKRAFKVIKGTLRKHFTQSLATGRHERGFCADCGSRLTGGESEEGIGITAGSLDDPSQFHVQVDMFAADAQPWDLMDPATPKFETYPT